VVTTLGLASGALTALSFLPQVIHAVRTGSTTDLSWAWLALFITGVTGWLTYGVATRDVAIIITNAVMVGFVLILLALKLRNGTTPGAAVHREAR
jgi:MtN3 and saliva related transmembrane protein